MRLNHLFTMLMASMMLAPLTAQANDINTAAYRVVETFDNAIEIRDYSGAMVIETRQSGDRQKAANQGFRPLFNYITGENEASQEISMTTPVTQEPLNNGSWAVRFYMPTTMQPDDTPSATAENVTVKQLDPQRVAAIQFSGTSSEDNMGEHETELRDFLKKQGLSHDDTPIYAFYDAPWVPWFMRRNEVMFRLTNSSN